jgi:hypothetical protein
MKMAMKMIWKTFCRSMAIFMGGLLCLADANALTTTPINS